MASIATFLAMLVFTVAHADSECTGNDCPVQVNALLQSTVRAFGDRMQADAGTVKCADVSDPPCGGDQELCSGGKDFATGCDMAGWCAPKQYGYNGSECSTSCPVTCGSGVAHCPNGMDDNGCNIPDTCLPPTGETDFWGNVCWPHCPMTCGGMDKCPGGVDPWNGCPVPETCVAKQYGYNGSECQTSCPVTCGSGEAHCPGGMDDNGCNIPDTCVPPTGVNDTWGNVCWPHCPMKCGSMDTKCPGGVDPWSGCPMGDTCAPKQYGYNGSECQTSSCPVTCGSDEIHCWGGMDDNGCPNGDTCERSGEECPTF